MTATSRAALCRQIVVFVTVSDTSMNPIIHTHTHIHIHIHIPVYTHKVCAA